MSRTLAHERSHPPVTPVSILYRNSENTVFLIDIPTSIQEAQGTTSRPCMGRLFSTEPIQEPFPTNEPKSESAAAKIQQNTVDAELHARYAHSIREALTDIRTHLQKNWCLPRITAIKSNHDSLENPRKRKDGPIDEHSENHSSESNHGVSLPPFVFHNMARLTRQSLWRSRWPEPLQHLCENEGSLLEAPNDPFYAIKNTAKEPQSITISDTELSAFPQRGTTYSFLMPGLSTFLLSDIKRFGHLHESIGELERQTRKRTQFDVILMDPPWPNASAKRRAGYRIHNTAADVMKSLLSMRLDLILKEHGYVGIWVTNKPALRELVLGQDGLFSQLNLKLVEEWIWIKTTINGEPVTCLDSLWRKPYEICLLGRRSVESGMIQDHIKPRVIAGVPDLHSRKPCLKDFIQIVVPDLQDYLGLELFARHLTSGWWSWGDEVLKFNWKGYWSSPSSEFTDHD